VTVRVAIEATVDDFREHFEFEDLDMVMGEDNRAFIGAIVRRTFDVASSDPSAPPELARWHDPKYRLERALEGMTK
jgi:hypothetical protein